MSEKLTPIQKLDFVLNWVATTIHPGFRAPNQICAYMRIQSEISSDEIELILDRLLVDKNVLVEYSSGVHKTDPHYKISFDGSVLYQQGGYEAQAANNVAEADRLTNIENR
ncbi:MAG: hypothetical protein ACHQET_01685 [Chitinophagales bacterium]